MKRVKLVKKVKNVKKVKLVEKVKNVKKGEIGGAQVLGAILASLSICRRRARTGGGSKVAADILGHICLGRPLIY